MLPNFPKKQREEVSEKPEMFHTYAIFSYLSPEAKTITRASWETLVSDYNFAAAYETR